MTREQVRSAVIEQIRLRVRGRLPDNDLDAERLDVLGIDSVGIISLLLDLEKDMALDFDRVGQSPPKLVGDLVRIALQGSGVER